MYYYMKNFSKLCTPAKIYFGIAVISAFFSLFNGASIMIEFWKILFAFIWTFILGWLCDKGYKYISWFLVLLPYIMMFLAMSNIYHTSEEQKQLMRMVKLQGAYGKEPFGTTSISDVASSADKVKKDVVRASKTAKGLADDLKDISE